MSSESTKRQGKQLLLRFPDASDLRERLSTTAEESNRSLSAEIIYRLESSFRDGHQARTLSPSASESRIAALETALVSMLAAISDINDKLEGGR